MKNGSYKDCAHDIEYTLYIILQSIIFIASQVV